MQHSHPSIRSSTLVPLVSLLLVGVAAVPCAHAKKATVRASWDEATSIHESGDFTPSVQVFLQSSERLQGRLAGMTPSGLRLQRKGSETVIARNDVRAIRFVSRKKAGRRNRLIALVAGVPAGFFGGAAVAARVSNICCDVRKLGPTELIMYGTRGGIQYALYKLGARADRGVLLVVLDESGTETSGSDRIPQNSFRLSDPLAAGAR